MNTYSFRTEQNTRIDVEASTPRAGYNKLMSIPQLRMRGITKSYIQYDRDEFGDWNWKTLRDD